MHQTSDALIHLSSPLYPRYPPALIPTHRTRTSTGAPGPYPPPQDEDLHRSAADIYVKVLDRAKLPERLLEV